MKDNIGTTDRIIRFVGALVIAYLYYTEVITGATGILLLLLAAVLFTTAIAGVCPLYKLLNINTTKKKANKQQHGDIF